MKFLVPEEEIQVGFLMMHRKNNMSDLVCTTCLHFIIITQPAHVWGHHQPTRETPLQCLFLFVLFDLILYVPSTIFQLNRDGSSLVEPVLS